MTACLRSSAASRRTSRSPTNQDDRPNARSRARHQKTVGPSLEERKGGMNLASAHIRRCKCRNMSRPTGETCARAKRARRPRSRWRRRCRPLSRREALDGRPVARVSRGLEPKAFSPSTALSPPAALPATPRRSISRGAERVVAPCSRGGGPANPRARSRIKVSILRRPAPRPGSLSRLVSRAVDDERRVPRLHRPRGL